MGEKRTMTDIKTRLMKILRSTRKSTWLLILGLCGILLIGASAILDDQTVDEDAATAASDTTAYVQALEARLEDMVSSIKGAGKARVMVTLENGVEYVYASEEKSNSDHTQTDAQISARDDSQRTIVTVDAENGKEGLLITEIQPTVRGVVVACEGAESEEISALVTLAVKTALDINDRHVCVIPYHDEGV